MERLIFHVDVNSAFLSWEAAKRVKEGLPDLREIPSCIGGDPKLRRSIVVAKSIPDSDRPQGYLIPFPDAFSLPCPIVLSRRRLRQLWAIS